METQPQSKFDQKRVIILLAALIVLLLGVLATVLLLGRTQTPEEDAPRIGYATDAQVFLDQDSLQAAMDEAMRNAQGNAVSLKYVNDATSTDGLTFDCYIANSELNMYDMFLTIFADAELTDQIYLSELVRPGSGFESITLDRALDPGDHMVYVAVTQVADDEETGSQVIKNQVVHTMDFHVAK